MDRSTLFPSPLRLLGWVKGPQFMITQSSVYLFWLPYFLVLALFVFLFDGDLLCLSTFSFFPPLKSSPFFLRLTIPNRNRGVFSRT